MKLFVLIISLFISSNSYCGNGSSGIGTATIIGESIIINNFSDLAKLDNGFLINKQTNEKIIKIMAIKKEDITKSKLSDARFGNVIGFEYTPHINSNENNYWIVCEKNKEKCLKLDSYNNGDKLIPSILGSLDYLQ